MTAEQQQPAFVLATRGYSETSLLIDFYTRHQGRIRLMAKGVRRKQQRMAILQPFNLLALGWKGRGPLKTLTNCEFQQRHALQSDSLIAGMYLNELLFYLTTEWDAYPGIFRAYQVALTELAHDKPIEQVLRPFEVNLLAELGYGINCSEDADGEPIKEDHNYYYNVHKGFVVASNKQGTLFLGKTIRTFSESQLSDASAEVMMLAKQLCRAHIDDLLDGKTLQSRAWYQHRMRNINPP